MVGTITLQRHLYEHTFLLQRLTDATNLHSLVDGDRKPAILPVQIWATHSSDVVGLILPLITAQAIIPTPYCAGW